MSVHTNYDIYLSLINFVAESCSEAAETGTDEQNRVQARGIKFYMIHDIFYKLN